MKSTELLVEDHRHMLAALDILVEMASRSAIEGLNDADVECVLRFFKDFGDRHHQGIEESILFPAVLQDKTQKNYHKLCGLIFEHNRQRSIMEGLQDSMLTRNKKDFAYYAGSLNEIVRAHIREEEEVVFPLVQSTLSAADDERVVQEMKAYDAVWQEKELAAQVRRLADLELKYLRRPA
jgi:hemerythrin-like domain-containing protein